MRRSVVISIGILSFFLLLYPACVEAEELPKPQGWVNDFASVIAADYSGKISALIDEVEKKTGSEIAVVTINSIAPYDEAGYARLIFDAWKIGKKGKDNGVLILVAVKERRWRIETGYGVEGILPDGLCGEIGRKYMVPYLKEGRYGEGLYNGVLAIASVIAKDAGVTMEGISLPKVRQDSGLPMAMPFFYIFCPVFFFLWNLPWPVFIGLPFTLVFAFAFYQISPILTWLCIASYIASMIFRYQYWLKLPPKKRGSLFGPQIYGGTFTRSSGWGSSGGGFGGGGFGGGGGGGGGSGGGF
jgi:uncharacterized protein